MKFTPRLTTHQERAQILMRDEIAREPRKEVIAYAVTGERPPIVEFRYSDGSAVQFDGRKWKEV